LNLLLLHQDYNEIQTQVLFLGQDLAREIKKKNRDLYREKNRKNCAKISDKILQETKDFLETKKPRFIKKLTKNIKEMSFQDTIRISDEKVQRTCFIQTSEK
jgi:DNA topoisomerase VI subunit B